MKNAAGEANLTVIVVVLIGVVASIGLVVVPRLMGNTQERACCTDQGGKWENDSCVTVEGIDFDSASYSKCIAKD